MDTCCLLLPTAVQNAKAIADGYTRGRCDNARANVFVQATTEISYTTTSGCSQGDSGSGNGSGSTDGSSAEATAIDR